MTKDEDNTSECVRKAINNLVSESVMYGQFGSLELRERRIANDRKEGSVGVERRGLQQVLIGRMTRFQGSRVNSVFLEGILQMSMVLRILCIFFICLAPLKSIYSLLFDTMGPKRTFRMLKQLFTYRAITSYLLVRLLPKRELLTLFLQMSTSKKAYI